MRSFVVLLSSSLFHIRIILRWSIRIRRYPRWSWLPSLVRLFALRLLLLRLEDDIDDGDGEGRVDCGDIDRLDADDVREPLLEARLDGLLLRGGEHIAVGREDELSGAAAEGWAVDAFAG